LEALARGGADAFYRGEIAQAIVSDMQANGGLISHEDLSTYRASWAEPIRIAYRGYDIATNPPPASGAALLQMLKLMEQFDLSTVKHSSAQHVQLLAEAMKRMTIDKERYHGDPDFSPVPLEMLLSDQYAAGHADAIRRGERARVKRFGDDK